MIKAFIFDWGGVVELIDNDGFIKEICEQHDIDKEIFKRTELDHRMKTNKGELSTKEYVNIINKELKVGIKEKDFFKLFFAKYAIPNRELLEIIKSLGKNYRIFMLTNNNTVFVEHMKNVYYKNLFEKVVVSSEEKLSKPDPRIFKKTLEGTVLSPNVCIFVDDTEKNIEVAKHLGFRTIHYKSVEDFVVRMAAMGVKLK